MMIIICVLWKGGRKKRGGRRKDVRGKRGERERELKGKLMGERCKK